MDCSTTITKEHWLSKNIIEQLYGDGLPPLVSGVPWLKGVERPIGANSLAAPVLCERHNSGLSPLDAAAGGTFAALWDFQQAQQDPHRMHVNDFAIVSGPHLERFLLKMLWGGCAAGSFGGGGAPVPDIRSDADHVRLLEALYSGGELPDGWGMFSQAHPVDPHGPQHSVGINTLSGPDGTAWGLSVDVGAVRVSFALGVPGRGSIHRPGAIILDALGTASEKVLAIAWPSDGHSTVTYTYGGQAS